MNKIYKSLLTIIFIFFGILEFSEAKKFYFLNDNISLNNNFLLGKSLNFDNKKYLFNEREDINKIIEISRKSTNEEDNSKIQDLNLNISPKSKKLLFMWKPYKPITLQKENL